MLVFRIRMLTFAKKMHNRLVALPGRQAAEHRRGGGREVVSISRVEGRTGDAARVPGVATSREVRAREPELGVVVW